MEFLIVCPLVFLAGLVDAIAGGGGLISLPAYFFAGLPVHNAIATNKLSSTMGTTVATIRYVMYGYMVKWLVVLGVACGLLGSFLGSNLALVADSVVLMVFMLVSLPLIAYIVLRTRDLDGFADRPLSRTRTFALTGLIAFAIGIYDGFYGPGTGTFLILLLTTLAHLPLEQAQGTTKAINLSTNFAALVVFLASGNAIVVLGLVAGLFNIAGNWIGATLFHKKGSSITRPIMLVVIVLFAIKLVSDLFGALL
ncbi:MAG: hypothetical protein DBY20_03040 [Coriobacteriia bacterium]|nr:MAG: hypothetical protein DBY20_03040 [Coriobacteriia bacterium]